MEVDIKLAESLIEAFNHEETGILLWDKNDQLLFRNIDIEKRFESLRVPFEIGTNFYDRISKIKKNKMLPNKDIETRIKNYELAKSSKKPQEMLVKGPTKRWMQVKDTVTPSGNILTLLTNVTKIVEQEEERKRLAEAIDNVPIGIMFWDENDKLISQNKRMSDIFNMMKVPPVKIGTYWKEMVKDNVSKGVYKIEEGMSEKNYIEQRILKRKKVTSSSTEQTYKDGSTALVNEIKLPDGGLMQLFTDISEMKNREKELKQLVDAIDVMPSTIHLWDKNNNLIMANESSRNDQKKLGFEMKKGASRIEMVKNGVEKGVFLPPKGQTKKQFILERKKSFDKLIDEDRREVEFSSGNFSLAISKRLSDGGTLQMVTNITEIKKKEIELKRLTDAIELTPTSIYLWDENDQLIMANKASRDFQKKLGFDLHPGVTRRQMVSTALKKKQIIPPKGMDPNKWLNDRLSAYNKVEKESKFETKFANDITMLGITNRLDDGGFLQVWTDISDLKEKEHQARLAEKRLQDAIDSMPHGISLWDKNDVLIMNNKYAYNIHKKAGIDNYLPGITFEEQMQAHKDKNFLKFESEEEKNKYFENAFKNRKSFVGTRTIEVPQFYDDSFWSATYTRLEDNSVFTIFSNITELKNRENDLRKTISQLDDEKEKANAANKTKSQFLANMSHELRTPLNAIIGLTEMLKEDATDDGLEDFVEPLDRVFNAGKHLLTLINDVLDLSKIEAGKIDLFNETFELKPIIDDIIKTSEPLAAKNENKLLLNFDSKIDQITSDQTRIKQVVLNLISNACKFTEKGSITVTLKKKNRTFVRNGRKISLGDLITVEISDTGIGMTQDQMDRLFNSFVQADSSTTRKYGGTGLGLTISKQLAIMMGGDVTVKSIINEGTTFIFTFLADYKDASEDTKNKKATESSLIKNVVSIENQTSTQNKNAKTILVIDDDPTVSELIKRQLTKDASYNVIIANNGKDGLKLAKEIKPNLITLDILMPEMDGWSVLRTLKADPEVSNIPVIMASILDEKNKGFSLGASDFVSKPIEKESLLNSIENLIGKSENLKICLIEDDENLRFTIKELLQKQGNSVIEAKNGKVGIELLKKEENLPDLILLDLMMPEMNGFEFLNQIKGTKLKSIPVLVLTGADLQDEDIKFLKGETEKVIQKTDDTVSSIAEEINKVMQTAG